MITFISLCYGTVIDIGAVFALTLPALSVSVISIVHVPAGADVYLTNQSKVPLTVVVR
jgi:hypothetical protein